MSAEILRKAAALMRERAEAATPGRWEPSDRALTHPGVGMDVYSDIEGPVVADCCGYQGGAGIEDAEHIASWHPAVALAVADWLEAEATALSAMEVFEATVVKESYFREVRGAGITVCQHEDGELSIATDTSQAALAVARAYLGSADD